MPDRLWPVDLAAPLPDGAQLGLRALARRDQGRFFALRDRDRDWLKPWEPTNPDGLPVTMSFSQLLRLQRQQARDGRAYSFAVTIGGDLAGQVTMSNIERGACRSCACGYWIARPYAGRGAIPTAVALVGDYFLRDGGMHRLELNIRPENTASLAVATKLGFRDEGLRRRYLHIDGEWRDHRSFAITREELGRGGLMARLQANPAEATPRHTEPTPELG